MINHAEIIKARVATVDYLAHIGITPDRHGMICCPFHGEKTASLKVYMDPRRGWHCFGCHAGGDVIDMVQKIEKVTFVEALKRLDAAFGLGLIFQRKADKQAIRAVQEEMARINRERERRRKRAQDAERAYWAAYDRWLENERIIEECAPKNPDEEETEEFAHAITHRTEILMDMENAEDRWRKALNARHDRRSNKMAQS